MARPSDRSNKTHLAVLPCSPLSELKSFRSWLGKQAAIGGRAHLERLIKSDEFTQRFNRHTGDTRLQALDTLTRVLTKAPLHPVAYRPSSVNDRVKVKWTTGLAARFLFEAPRSKDDRDLCRRLGLPVSCRGSMRARRSDFGILRAPATVKTVERLGASLVASMPLAA